MRLHDQVALNAAAQQSGFLVPIYCLDPRHFANNEWGLPKTGRFRAKFLFESLLDLKRSLRDLGSDLLILHGKPEVLIPELAKKIRAEAIFFSEEVTDQEVRVVKALEAAVEKIGIKTEPIWQQSLFHIQDLPFPVSETPDVFTAFRKDLEKSSRVRPAHPVRTSLTLPKIELDWENFPDASSLGFDLTEPTPMGTIEFKGGETEGLRRVQTYLWELDAIKDYKHTRNGLLGANYSSKFSPWLALGCISPRFIYWEIMRYEKERTKNESTYWLVFELIWRDYFRFIAKKHGNKIFGPSGIKPLAKPWRTDEKLFWRWAKAQTGIPFVDANMRELNATGFMSNRGRQNVASFLVNDLGIDWRWGASYFESLLIDYDVCSNWGNWMYIAGVGNDPLENRYFNINKQARTYDDRGEYVRNWIPELKYIPDDYIHCPIALTSSDLERYGVYLGSSYPFPMVDLPKT